MKRLMALATVGVVVAGLLALPATGGTSPEEEYVAIYKIIEQAEALGETSPPAAALAKYQEAQAALTKFQGAYPDWNPLIVNMRLQFLAEKIAGLQTLVTSEPDAAPKTAAPGATPAMPTAPMPTDIALELKMLQEQLRQAEADKALLEAKLKEALSAQPAATDPRELARAYDKIRLLEEENRSLKASVEQLQAQAGRPADRRALEQAKREVAELKRTLERQNKAAVLLLAEANEKLDRQTRELAARTQERDQLKNQLAAAQAATPSRTDRATPARVKALTDQLNAAKARLQVYEARAVPYTTEELALFKKPAPVVATTDTSKTAKRRAPAMAELMARADQQAVSGDLPKAEEGYKEVVSRNAADVRALCNLATTQAAQNRIAEAEETIGKALAIDPNDPSSLGVLAFVRYTQGQYDEALDLLSRAVKQRPQDAALQNLLGLNLVEKGLRGPAETAFRKALQAQPGFADAHRNLAVLYLAQQPPLVELARWHYQKARAAGLPSVPDLEKKLEAAAAAPGSN